MNQNEKERLKHLVAASGDIVGRDKMRIMQCIDEFEEWVPVKERLPEDMEIILINDICNNVFIGKYSEHLGAFDAFDQYYTRYQVTHWKPIPKPPEEL